MEVVSARILPASTLSRFGSVTNSIRMVPLLNRTVRTNEPGHPTLGQVEVDLVDGLEITEVLGQTGCWDRSHLPTVPSGAAIGALPRALASTVPACGARSRRSAGCMRNPKLRAELLARMDADRAVRDQVAATWPGGTPVDTSDPLFIRWRQVDHDNTSWLREIVTDHGWPGKSLVGRGGAQAAWLLAQHADDSPDFQRHCLELMTAAVESGEASASDLAYLVDRVAVHEGRPQTYGTQHEWRGGTCVPVTIEDPEHVDARRRAAGLGPLAAKTAALNAGQQPPRRGR
jgi:hypothetical protein